MPNPSSRALGKYEKYFRGIYTSLFATIMALIFGRLYYSSVVILFSEVDWYLLKFHDKLIFNLLGLSIVLFATLMIFYYFDNLDLLNKKAYLEEKTHRPLITRGEYLTGFLINILFASPVFYLPVHYFMVSIGATSPMLSHALALLTMALMRLIQLGSLRMKWQDEIDHPLFVEKPMFKSSGDVDSFKPFHLFTKPIIFVILYSLCYAVALKYVIAMIFSIYLIVTSLWSSLIVMIVVPIAIFFSLRVISMFRRRRRLIKKLNELKRQKYATVKYRGSKYLSSLFHFLKLEVEIITASGEKYNCRVVTSGRVNAPMYFSTENYYTEHGLHLRGGGLLSQMGSSPFVAVVDISKWGGNSNPTNLVLGFRRQRDLVFPDKEGKKALIVNPTPTSCFSLYGTVANTIDTGEDMGKYTIYTATGIYNTIVRNEDKEKY